MATCRSAIFAGALVAIVALLLWPFDTEGQGRLQGAVWQFAHFPALWLAAYLLMDVGQGRGRALRLLPVRLIVLVVAVPLFELLQNFTGRTPSWVDVAWGWLGIAAAVTRSRRMWWATALIALIAMIPLVALIMDHAHMKRAFPVLASFDQPLESGRWSIRGMDAKMSPMHARIGRRSLRIDILEDEAYPGLFMEDTPADWSSAHALVFSIYLDGEDTLGGWVRIDDRRHPAYADRFQEQIWLNPRWNTIRIEWGDALPASGGRTMDRTAITTWGIFFAPDDAGRTLYLDAVWLDVTGP